jgi:hypothetical protein
MKDDAFKDAYSSSELTKQFYKECRGKKERPANLEISFCPRRCASFPPSKLQIC